MLLSNLRLSPQPESGTLPVLRVSALMLSLHGSNDRVLQLGLISAAVIGLFLPLVLTAKATWWAICASLSIAHIGEIYTTDNHKVLLIYWTMALALTTTDAERQRCLAARMIGACFLCATIWKIASTDFATADFFAWTLQHDQRFHAFASFLSGVSQGYLDAEREAVQQVLSTQATEALLGCPEAVWRLANGLTAWTLAIEAVVAIVFLLGLPGRRGPLLGHCALILFILTTYSIAPVAGFAWQLAVMGFAACRVEDRGARSAYLVCLALIQAFLLPWADLFGGAS